MILNHYSVRGLREFEPRTQLNIWGDKPCGLWLSVGEQWLDFCRSDIGRLPRTVQEVRVDESRLLRVPDEDALRAFTDRFQTEPPRSEWDTAKIDWRAVAELYAGILIPFYSKRVFAEDFRMRWFYSWDVGCACVWDADAILDIGPPLSAVRKKERI